MQLLGITFLEPLFLCGVLLIPVFLYLYYIFEKKYSFFLATADDIQQVFGSGRGKFVFKYILLLFIFNVFFGLFANPNIANTEEEVKKNGIDIVLAFDISESMLAEDMQPNRLEKAKKVLTRFIEQQETNRVGLVIFSGKTFTGIPLTFDYNILTESLERLTPEMIRLGGTAIGDAIFTAKNTFGEEKREKVIILLTDGDANLGAPPEVAALRAKEMGIKIYTIGIGSDRGGSFLKNMGPFTQRIQIPPLDGQALQKIADITGGIYYRAKDNTTLQKVFSDLEQLEKHDVTVQVHKNYTDLYDEFGIVLLILIILYFFLVVGGVPSIRPL